MLSRSIQSLIGRQLNSSKAPAGFALFQQIRSVFIQTSETPNPESLKFIPSGVAVLPDVDNTGNGYFVTKSDGTMEILKSPLAKKLFDVDGVKAVYLGADFVTVTKFAEHKWKIMRPQLFEVLMNWADSGEPALVDAPIVTDTTILDDDDEVVAMIKELIESRIRPAVQEDGGDIRYVGFDEETGVVTVQLAGSCVGCPSSSVTLKNGVENMLMHYIPEVKHVVALEEPAETEADSSESGAAVGSEAAQDVKKQRTYEERLADAGIPFSN
jgi:NFU1 iron-sulfur cluster scaffold homolog, mitochondrial